MRCAALVAQHNIRDLQLLSEFAEVVWLDTTELVKTDSPAVICGLWVSQSPAEARELLRARSSNGHATLLVPRFRGGDLGPVLGAPSAVVIHPGEANSVTWRDAETYEVSAVSYIDTPLTSERWAKAANRSAILCYRPYTAAGAIVVCTATLTGRAIGVHRTDQARLLTRILTEIAPSKKEQTLPAPTATSSRVILDIDSFLAATGAAGAALTLALVACHGNRGADLADVGRKLLGIELSPKQMESLMSLLPPTELKVLEDGLRRAGWGAHLRRVRQLLETETRH